MSDHEDSTGEAAGGADASVRRLGAATATLVVVANMVGTGVFTTTGFLIRDVQSPLAVLLGWLVGGVFALCGALCYSELVAALPRNGGEYQILARVFHPLVGFVAGWISLIVGFSAPIAASALAFGRYFGASVGGVDAKLSALLLVLALSALHAVHVTAGSRVQNVFTVTKVALIAVMIAGGLVLGSPERIGGGSVGLLEAATSPAFAVGLIFISFSYSGWNGAAYLAGEVKAPARSLPLALVAGTLIVAVLYVGLNYVILSAAPPAKLAGVVEVGHVAAVQLFGQRAGSALSGVIALALVSSVSAMVMAGPRVYQAIGEDSPRLAFLAHRTSHGGPWPAVLLQAAVAVAMLLSATFELLLTYIGFTLSLSAGLTVAGVFVLRAREPELERPYKALAYPVSPLLFIALACWMMLHTLLQRPVVALAGLGTIASGAGLYFLLGRQDQTG